jgi:DNA-binding NarL/FixJ family response regulator
MLLFLAPPGEISDHLVHALEREYPWAVVARYDTVQAALASFTYPVATIAFSSRLAEAAEAAASDIIRCHPQALAALIDGDGRTSRLTLPEVLKSRVFRAVLPMNLRLDLWLSVVGLMLRGGEYYPARMVRSHTLQAGRREGAILPEPTPARANAPDIDALTRRELQILELVSHGSQNKTIAGELSLSEHTVKIHLHNIIRKLGTHNRTEAALRFRDYQARRNIPLSQP